MKLTTYLDLERTCYHICLCGELDACSSLLLDEAMGKAIRQRPREIQVNCQELHYISSAGLGVFVSYLQTLSSKNISLILHDLSPGIKSTFGSIGLPSLASLSSESESNLVLTGCLYAAC